jgi:hypothetical protein
MKKTRKASARNNHGCPQMDAASQGRKQKEMCLLDLYAGNDIKSIYQLGEEIDDRVG